MRKLVTVRMISEICPIENADQIERATVDGWYVVVQKGYYAKGDLVVYFEVDSFLPSTDIRFESFMKFGTREFEGAVGHRIKTKKLRGVYSQGVIIPLREFPEITQTDLETDYSELLGVKKYEKQEVTGNCGAAKGNFPYFLRKSDQERLQNIYSRVKEKHGTEQYVGTLKIDGSSLTIFGVSGEKFLDRAPDGFLAIGLCSRNMELKLEKDIPEKEQGKFYQGALNSNLFSKIEELCINYEGNYALQGELVGAGIQGSYEKIEKYQVYVYNIFDIDAQEYVDYTTFKEMTSRLGIQTVPEIYPTQEILALPLQEIIQMSDGESIYNKVREGIVWKSLTSGSQFKVISNKFLAEEED